jgi:hypothetical protein
MMKALGKRLSIGLFLRSKPKFTEEKIKTLTFRGQGFFVFMPFLFESRNVP